MVGGGSLADTNFQFLCTLFERLSQKWRARGSVYQYTIADKGRMTVIVRGKGVDTLLHYTALGTVCMFAKL